MSIALLVTVLVLNAYSKYFEFRRDRAISAYVACDYGRAISELEAVVRHRPRDAYAQAVLGEAYLHSYKYETAEAHLRRAVTLSPQYTYASQALAYDVSVKQGMASFHAGNFADAISELQPAVRFRPGDAYIQVMLGYAYLQREQFDNAERAFELALRSCPRYSYAKETLGYIYVRTNRDEDAVRAYSEVAQQDPGNESARLGLGTALNNLDRHDEAIATFQEAVRRHPESAEAQYWLGLAYADAKRYREAIRSLNEALRLQPDHQEARKEMAVVLRAERSHHRN